MFTDYYLPTLGGVQTSIKAQKEALESLGHQVTVLCPLSAPSEDPTIIRLPTHRRIAPDGYPLAWSPQRVYRASLSALQRIKPDLVHVHSELFVAFAGMKAAHTLGLPLVQTMHGRLDVYTQNVLPLPTLTTRLYERLHNHYISHAGVHIQPGEHYTRRFAARNMWRNMVAQANNAHHVIVPSAHFAHKLRAQGVHRPLTVISNGLEKSVIDALDCAPVRTREAGEPLRIMWCGRVSPEKRPLVFLDAICQLDFPLHVDMYGDGLALKDVRKFIESKGLGDRVTVHGGVPQAEVFEAMRRSHVFVSSSFDFDNQPMVMLEAIATGLPVIYCDPDLAEVVPEDASLCTPTPEAHSLAETLTQLAHDPALVQKLSGAALAERHRTEQNTFLGALLDVYTATIKEHSKP